MKKIKNTTFDSLSEYIEWFEREVRRFAKEDRLKALRWIREETGCNLQKAKEILGEFTK